MAVSFAEINGTTIAYDVIGDGPPLLLLNGVMMTMQSWALQAVGCAYPPEWFGAFAKLCEAADAVCDEIERFLGSESRP